MRRAVALASWLADSGPRLLTGREVLRKPDVPAAAAAIGVKAPQTLRRAGSAGDGAGDSAGRGFDVAEDALAGR